MKTTPEQVYNQFRDRYANKYIADASNKELRAIATFLGIQHGNAPKELLIRIICKIAPKLA